MQQNWIAKLIGFDYEVGYHKGEDNVVANGLSQQFNPLENVVELSVISMPFSTFLVDIGNEILEDPASKSLLDQL